MKKFLLSIFAVLFAFAGVQAEEVTFVANGASSSATNKVTLSGNLPSGNSDYVDFSMTKVNNSTSNVNSGLLRWYKNDIVNLTPKNGVKITKVVITMGGDSKYMLNVSPNVGSSSISNGVVTWTGETSETLELTASEGQVRFSTLVVTYTTSGEGGGETVVETVATPVITAESTTFNESESLTVTIETETEGAEIYYTLDGSDPVENGDLYEGEIELTETTTVKAVAKLDGWNNSAVAEATFTAVDPNAKEVEATISFASTAQRTSQDTEKQVWQNEGVTFTNNKASSSSNVASYSNPVRLYAGSNVVVEHEAMTKILFVCNGSSYATVLENSIGTAATVTVDGSNVTVTFVNPVDEFAIEKLTKQVQLKSLTVTYLTTQKVVKTPVITPESCGFYAGENVEVSITAEEGTIYYTTDGNEPTTSSEVYSVPFTVSETTTVKAIAVVDGTESEVATVIYTKGIEGSVADALDAYVDGERLLAAVTGYIVGYVDGSSVGDAGTSCVFDSEGAVATNILIADDPYETDYAKCLAVQLPNNEIRTALNLQSNPNNYQVKVVIKGSLEKYLSTAGLKDAVSGELIDELYHTLTVSEAGYATLFLGFNARIPSAVEAYTVTTVNDGWVSLTQVTGVLPSNQGVIIKAPAGDYKLFYEETATADVTGNLLMGTLVDKYINEDAYVLANGEVGVGLYKAEMNKDEAGEAGTTHFKNNANKAYLPASALTPAQQTAAFYGFDWDGTTGIDEITDNREQSTVIYDLAGRRVENPSNGIYIINGVKVLVK